MLLLTLWMALGCAARTQPAPPPPAGDPDLGIGQLEWMVGRWVRSDGSSISEETWSPLLGGTMVGSNRTIEGDQTRAFEFLKLEQGERGVTYRAWPGGGPPTAFALITLDGQRAVFENPAHDFPTRIEYIRDGDELTARISDSSGEGASWSWSRAEP